MVSDDAINSDAISADRLVNPAIPDSLGALLAEEWTVNARSTLPSFLERMMMEEARRSGWETLRSIFGVLEDRIDRMVINHQRRVFDETFYSGFAEKIRRVFFALFRRWPIRAFKALLRNVIRPFGPELRFAVVYALERGSLMRSNASITDALYGGKRVRLGEANVSNENERRLLPIGKQDRVRLSFFLAFGPYLEERSKLFFPYFDKPSLANGSPDAKSTRKRLQTVLNVVWPLLRMTTKGTFLWYRWRYLLGRSVFFDPYSSLLNLVVRRTTMEDQHQKENAQQSLRGEGVDGVNSDAIRMATIRNNTLGLIRSNAIWWAAGGLTSFFIALAFTARIRSIRQLLYQERELQDVREIQERQRRSQQEDAVTDVDIDDPLFKSHSSNVLIPSPPLPPLPCRTETMAPFSSFGDPADRNFGLCPLCNEPRIHPTASTGGYVFCLKCILDFLRQNGAVCPVSRKPCTESSLVRLYEPTHRT